MQPFKGDWRGNISFKYIKKPEIKKIKQHNMYIKHFRLYEHQELFSWTQGEGKVPQTKAVCTVVYF